MKRSLKSKRSKGFTVDLQECNFSIFTAQC